MRRQSTDYYKPEEPGSKNVIYTWDTPKKDQVNNYEAFNSGMLNVGFRFNLNQ